MYNFQPKTTNTIQAFQMTRERRRDNREWPDWLNEAWSEDPGSPRSLWTDPLGNSNESLIFGLSGQKVYMGDYIILNDDGCLSTICEHVFEAKYEPVGPKPPDGWTFTFGPATLHPLWVVSDTISGNARICDSEEGARKIAERWLSNSKADSPTNIAIGNFMLVDAITNQWASGYQAPKGPTS